MDILTAVGDPDFTPIVTGIVGLAPLAVAAIAGTIAAALSIMAVRWGFPLIVGFFKKNAK